MYCKNCGTQLDDNAVICPNCGCATDNFYKNGAHNAQNSIENDAPSAGFAVLSFCFPLVGLILYLVWQNTMPLRAKSCGKGALVGVIAAAAVSLIAVVFVLLMIMLAGVGMTYYM